MYFNPEYIALLIPAVHVLGIAHALHAVMHVRTSQGAVAWSLSLVSVPFIAIPLYWIFGRSKFDEYVEMLRETMRRHHDRVAQTKTAYGAYAAVIPESVPVSQTVLEQFSFLPFARGNELKLLVDGDATFEAIFEAMRGATLFIMLQTYILRDDDLGRKLKEILIERAKAGVAVYCLLDSIGCLALADSYVNELTAAGVEVHFFRAGKKRLLSRFQLNFRSHRKIVVVDGVTAFIGGHNFGDEYLGKSKLLGPWRDTHIRVRGPAVTPIQISFSIDWIWAAGKEPSRVRFDLTEQPANQAVLILPTGPSDTRESSSLLFNHLIVSARKRIWLASPYFVPDEAVMHALMLAVLRGVDVRILTADEPDHFLVYLAGLAYCADCALAGVRIFRYHQGFMHQKVALVDDSVSVVGTANLDNRSFRLNFEMSAVVVDEGFAREVEAMLAADFARSEVFDCRQFESRSWLRRAMVQGARLFSPIL
jgi:cardiolipin synthase